MSSLSLIDRARLEDILQMEGGYVLSFSNSQFASLVASATNINIEDKVKYPTPALSKAKRLRKFWDEETDYNVGKLNLELLSFAERGIRSRRDWCEAKEEDLNQLKQSLKALMLGSGNLALPDSQDADEKELKNQIELAINQGKPSIALDRLHTLSTKVLKSVCASNGIALQNAKKERYNVAQLVGMLWKKYQDESVFQS